MSNITMTNIDPGEGAPLSSDNFLAVYGQTGLLDLFYPVGSYYKTTNTSFDPNVFWGGVWEEDTDYDLVAYAKIDGTTIRASKNIDNISRTNTGVIVVTLSKQMADTNGIIELSAETTGLASEIVGCYWNSKTKFTIDCGDYTGTAVNPANWFVLVYGKLEAPEFKKWKRTA